MKIKIEDSLVAKMEAYYLRQSKGYYPLVLPSFEAFNKTMSSKGYYSSILPSVEPLNKTISEHLNRKLERGGVMIVKHSKHHGHFTNKPRNNNKLIRKPSSYQNKVQQKPKTKRRKKKK